MKITAALDSLSPCCTRRQFLRGAAAGGALAAAPPQRPNLVFVLADQLRYASCGYAGDPLAQTPNLDRLARQSVNFRQATVSHPLCAPFRATLMTGKYSSSTGMVINELRLSPEHECIGHVLTRAGYRTALIGKWHLWANELGHHDRTENGFVPPGPYRLGFDDFWAAYNFNHNYFRAPYFRDEPKRLIHPGYEPDSQTRMAIEVIQEASAQGRPFAVFLLWGPPHDPWTPDNVPAEDLAAFHEVRFSRPPNFALTPDPYADNWARMSPQFIERLPEFMRVYYAQTRSLDRALGRLMSALDELKLAEDTILVFTSDHGELFGAHGRRAKNIFYEEAVRTPFLLRWPRRLKPGVTDVCFSSPDIMPTLLGLMGLPIPRAVEGFDFSSYLSGRSSRVPDAAYLQGMGTTAAWRDGSEWRALRDGQYTYAIFRADGKELLFDHRADPLQMRNLAGERAHRARLEHYRNKLRRWMREHNDTFEACTWYERNWTVDRNIIMTASGVKQDLGMLKEILRKYFPEQSRRPGP
jgi:arylsulfatase A-like enzyme